MSERDLVPPAVFIDGFIKSAVRQGIGVTVIYAFKEGTRLRTRIASTAEPDAARAMLQMVAKRPDMRVEQSALTCPHANETPAVCPCPDGCYCKANTCNQGN